MSEDSKKQLVDEDVMEAASVAPPEPENDPEAKQPPAGTGLQPD